MKMMNVHMKKQCLLCEIMTQRPLVETCSGVCGEPLACEGLLKAAMEARAACDEPDAKQEMREGIKNYRIEWDDPI